MATNSDLPLCMQEGWDPTEPGKDYQRRLLDAAEEADRLGDSEERDRLLDMARED